MIFGSPEGSETATIKDPSGGANLIRVGEDVSVDVVESDFIDIGKVVEIGTREMESVELVEDSAVTPDFLPVPEITNPVPEVSIPVPEVTVPVPETEVKKLSEAEIIIEKDRKYDINRYKFFDSKRKPANTGSSSSSASSGNIQSAAPTLAEFACSDESSLGYESVLHGIDSIRLSETFGDLSTQGGYQKALKATNVAQKPIHLHGSLPCTPWCRWSFLNVWKLGADFHRRLQSDRAKSIIMLGHF